MYTFRPFRNADPPRIADIWRDQPPQRGRMQPVTATILEHLVFSKPYFDPAGLILALDGDTPVGFVHAGFGANDEQTNISFDTGTTYQLLLRSDHRNATLAGELLTHAETYLRERGAKVIYAGGIRPLDAFYLGLYGGSELPGILPADAVFHAACHQRSYREIDRVQILQLELAQFRPPITRSQRQLRREMVVQEIPSPPATSWWDACTIGAFERVHFLLTRPSSSQPLADVWFWDIEPLSTFWGSPTAGMLDLKVSSSERRKGLATYLLAEAFDRLRTRGIHTIEAQTMQHNTPALTTYGRLGFQQIEQGAIYRKDT